VHRSDSVVCEYLYVFSDHQSAQVIALLSSHVPALSEYPFDRGAGNDQVMGEDVDHNRTLSVLTAVLVLAWSPVVAAWITARFTER